MNNTCPVDNTELDAGMTCPKCKRQWEWKQCGDEQYMVSKMRRVSIIAPPTVGARLDDCIKPIDGD